MLNVHEVDLAESSKTAARFILSLTGKVIGHSEILKTREIRVFFAEMTIFEKNLDYFDVFK